MSTQGQILNGSLFATWLTNVISENKPKTIVEIGTWKGLGSTKVIIDSIIVNKLKTEFISLESNKNFYETAVGNLVGLSNHVKLIYGRVIEQSDILQFVNENVLTPEMNDWLSADLRDYDSCPHVLNLLPNEIDFLLLDGGEFSTYKEWKVLKDRTKIVALDDSLVLKCFKIRQELLQDNNYELIVDSKDRNGFTIFKKK
jgi:hypothetical protein